MSISSKNLKAEAMAWLRYVRRCPWVCSEVGDWHADIYGVDAKHFSTEVEIKVSIADLRAEFKGKKAKHILYARGGPGSPNRLFYMVPQQIIQQTLEILSEKPYGVIAYEDKGLLLGRNLEIQKACKVLHRRPITDKNLQIITSRMASELVGLWANAQDSENLKEILRQSHRFSGPLETDKETRQLLLGRELASILDLKDPELEQLQFLQALGEKFLASNYNAADEAEPWKD